MKIRLAILLICLLASNAAAQPLLPPLPRADDGSVIDVLVLYTQNARAVAGGTHPQTIAMIQSAVAGVNQAFSDSAVLTQLNVVLYEPVFYLEQVNEDFHADLTNLSGTSDGYLDEIHALRDYYAADVVLMVAGTWFYIYTGDSDLTVVPYPLDGFAVWEAKGLDDDGGIYPSQWIARLLGVDDTPPFAVPDVATMNANRAAVANYRDSATRVITPMTLTQNGGFEVDMDADGVPDFWAASGWTSGDKRVCGAPNVHSGDCSVKLNLSSGGKKRLKQTVDGGSININDQIWLTASYKVSGGERCITVTLIIEYSASNTPVILKSCSFGAFSWSLAVAGGTAEEPVSSVKAKIKASGTGKIWLDDVDIVLNLPAPRGGGR